MIATVTNDFIILVDSQPKSLSCGEQLLLNKLFIIIINIFFSILYLYSIEIKNKRILKRWSNCWLCLLPKRG